MPKPDIRLLLGSVTAIGPGKAELMERIAATGSISAAARDMGMSYRRAWVLVDTMNRCFREPLVVMSRGGRGGGGAHLSATGQEILTRYRQMERTARSAVAAEVADIEQFMAETVPRGTTSPDDEE